MNRRGEKESRSDMELLERYLQAVGKHLPARRRDDIVDELRANLLERVEDREAELGRPLTVAEEAEMLKQHGHPLLVAMRYFPRQHLIGPTVFPYYWFILKVAMGLAALVYTVTTGVMLAVGNATPPAVGAALLRLPGMEFTVAAWVTLVFAVADLGGERLLKKCNVLDGWSPRTLPAVAPRQKGEKSPLVELLFHFFFAIYLLAVARYPYLMFGPGAAYFKSAPVQLAPVVYTVYWAFVAMALVQVALQLAYLFGRGLRRFRRPSDVIFRGLGVAILVVLVRARELIVVIPSVGDSTAAQRTAEQLNSALQVSFKIALAVMTIHVLWEGYQWIVSGRRAHSTSHGNGETVRAR